MHAGLSRRKGSSVMVLRVTLSVAGLLVVLASFPNAAPRFSDWSSTVNLGSIVNSSSNDTTPSLSKDGKSLYFTSNRQGGAGATDIWVSPCDDMWEAWGPPLTLGAGANKAFR